MNDQTKGVHIDGIVAMRDKQPYIRIHVNGEIAQCSIADARKIAADIVEQAARAEADAMIVKFFAKNEFPDQALYALLVEFRDFRLKLDQEPVEGTYSNPETDEPV